jgi:hypothetical protein
VNHQPQATVTIRLKLGEMVAAAERSELECALAAPEGFELRVTQ